MVAGPVDSFSLNMEDFQIIKRNNATGSVMESPAAAILIDFEDFIFMVIPL